MVIDVIKHVAFEGAANIESWTKARGHEIRNCDLWQGQDLPEVEGVEFLAVMGGPMGVYDYQEHSWLRDEKKFIRSLIDAGKMVLGICLGAQLIADVLGGKVVKNDYREIGWWEVEKTEDAKGSVFDFLPDRFMTFQWHGDRFSIAQGAVRLAGNEACENQAFGYERHVLGLQFHLEYNRESIEDMNSECRDELEEGGEYVQSEDYIMRHLYFVEMNEKMLFDVLDEFCRRNGK